MDVQTVIAVHQAKVNLYFVLSDFKNSRAEGERLLVLAQQAVDRGKEAIALAGMGMASTFGHDFDRGLAEAHQAITIAREIEATPVLAGGFLTSGLDHAVTGCLDEAWEEIDLAITISRSGSDVVHQSRALALAGVFKNWQGEYPEALLLQAEALRLAREHTLLIPLIHSLWTSGLTLIGKGDYDEALTRFEEGLVLSEQEFADQCLELAMRTRSRKYVVKGWRLLGEIALARRQRDEAVGWLQQALTLAQTIGNLTQLSKTHLALGHLHTEARRPEQARQAYQAAREVIDRVKASLKNPELRASLEQSPIIQQVYDVSPSS